MESKGSFYLKGQLEDLCRELELPFRGNKPDLIDRIEQYVARHPDIVAVDARFDDFVLRPVKDDDDNDNTSDQQSAPVQQSSPKVQQRSRRHHAPEADKADALESVAANATDAAAAIDTAVDDFVEEASPRVAGVFVRLNAVQEYIADPWILNLMLIAYEWLVFVFWGTVNIPATPFAGNRVPPFENTITKQLVYHTLIPLLASILVNLGTDLGYYADPFVFGLMRFTLNWRVSTAFFSLVLGLLRLF